MPLAWFFTRHRRIQGRALSARPPRPPAGRARYVYPGWPGTIVVTRGPLRASLVTETVMRCGRESWPVAATAPVARPLTVTVRTVAASTTHSQIQEGSERTVAPPDSAPPRLGRGRRRQ